MNTKWLTIAALFVAFLGASLTTSAQEELPDGLRFPEMPPENQPSHEIFAEWPPGELFERAYWLPWNEMAFRRAALFGRPVLFVMTTGWSGASRQMVEETFATPTLLRNINANYIAVLVNADRRPDLKERYQTGTWPVVEWLIPNGLPMLSQANDPGVAQPITAGNIAINEMLFLLIEGDKYWKKWPDLLLQVADEWTKREALSPPNRGPVDEVATDQVEAWLLGNADRVNGGFGAAPKFVVPGLHEYARIRDARLRPALKEHSLFTLERLVASPLYDATEGGVHRLASLPDWGGIQAEKMLVGNTALLRELFFALAERPSESLRRAAGQTAGFITDVLARPGGGFYFAQGTGLHADSSTSPPADAARPVDPHVFSGPNALAGAALLRMGVLLGDEELIQSGTAAMELVRTRGFEAGLGVRHVIEPNPNPRVFLTAQADTAFGLLDAYEVTGDTRYLEIARAVVDFTVLNLRTPGEGAIRDHLADPQAIGLLSNPRHPLSPNSRLARAARRLQIHGAGERYRKLAGEILGEQCADLTPFAVHGTDAGLAIEEWIRDPLVIRIDGPPEDEAVRQLRRAAVLSSWPWTVVTTGDPSVKPAATISFAETESVVTRPETIAAGVRRITRTE